MEFREYVRVLRARKATVLLSVVLFMLAALAVHVMRPTAYTAESRVLVSQADAVNALLGIAPAGLAQPDRDMATHAELVRSPEVAATVVERLSLRTTPAALASRVLAEPVGGSDLLAIRAQDSSPARAAAIANAFASVYVERRIAEQKAEIDTVKTGLAEQRKAVAARVAALDKQARSGKTSAIAERDSAAASLAEIDGQIERLGTGQALDLAGTRIVGTASEDRTAGGGGLTTALLVGAALGFVVGVGAAFTAEHFDTRILSAKQAGNLGLPVVGALPAERTGKGSASLTMLREPSSPGSDAYRLLRQSMRSRAVSSAPQVVAVTAPGGPGHPPTVAANLAIALAHAGDRVTLIDCDLRRSPLQAMFGLQGSAGLSDVLAGARQLSEVAQRPVHQRLVVVAGGGMPAASAELLGSPRMQQIVREAASFSDWVLLSLPPLLETADAVTVADWAERLLLVLRVRETRQEQAQRAIDLLGRMGSMASAEVVLLGVQDGGQGLEAYLVPAPQAAEEEPVAGGMETLRPREAMAR